MFGANYIGAVYLGQGYAGQGSAVVKHYGRRSILDLKLPLSPYVKSVSDIIEHLKGIRDQRGELIYGKNVFRGLEEVKAAPQDEQTPCIHVWENTVMYENTAVQYSINGLVGVISIFIFAFDFSLTKNDTGIQQQLDNLCLYTAQAFYPLGRELPANRVNNPGMDFDNNYRKWSNPQAIICQESNPLARFRGAYKADPGWYVREIRLKFETLGVIKKPGQYP